MNCAVFDTWVDKKEGGKMHFDIIVPTNTDHEKVVAFGKSYLAEKQQHGQLINAKNCSFCHIEQASEIIVHSILEKGYYILEMQGCN